MKSEKARIFYNVWCCAHRRRHNAKLKENWELYWREHETLLMCLKMKDAKWWIFEEDKYHLKVSFS